MLNVVRPGFLLFSQSTSKHLVSNYDENRSDISGLNLDLFNVVL